MYLEAWMTSYTVDLVLGLYLYQSIYISEYKSNGAGCVGSLVLGFILVFTGTHLNVKGFRLLLCLLPISIQSVID